MKTSVIRKCYAICVSMDMDDYPAVGTKISNTVNKLAEYLDKH